jgi:archaea-specific DNA-binding protein
MPEKDSAVLIGTKPVMSYVLAVVTQFGGGRKEVVIKARGNAISKAVDVAEIIRHKFAKDVIIKDIKTATETMGSKEGREISVSIIAITLGK